MRIELKQLEDSEICKGCGKCCESIGLPPFNMPNPDHGHVENTGRFLGEPYYLRDYDIYFAMPSGLRSELAIHQNSPEKLPVPTPCLWLDLETKRCKNYQYRPITCREWAPYNRDCTWVRNNSGHIIWINSQHEIPPRRLWKNPLLDPTPTPAIEPSGQPIET